MADSGDGGGLPPGMPIGAQAVGAIVATDFGEIESGEWVEIVCGTITGYLPSEGLYMCMYDDGDECDFDEDELARA